MPSGRFRKKKIRRYLLVAIPIICLLVGLTILLVPDTASAAGNSLVDTLRADNSFVKEVWKIMLGIVDVAVVIGLIVVSFANILRIQIDVYAVKKALPAIITGVLLANLSYLICTEIIQFTQVLSNAFLSGFGLSSDVTNQIAVSSSGSQQKVLGDYLTLKIGSPEAAEAVSSWEWMKNIVGQLGIIVGAIMVLALAYLLYIRIYVIYFVVILSPLAFFCMGLPMLKQYFQMWWSQWFVKWVFMSVIVSFWLWLAFAIINAINTITVSENQFFFVGYIFMVVCFYLALTTPFKMGGAIMGTWGKVGKWGVGLWTQGSLATAHHGYRMKTQDPNRKLFFGRFGPTGQQMINFAGWTNPQYLKEAAVKRFEIAKKEGEKRVRTSSGYLRFAGPLQELETKMEIFSDDYKNMDPLSVASDFAGHMEAIKRGRVWQQYQADSDNESTEVGKKAKAHRARFIQSLIRSGANQQDAENQANVNIALFIDRAIRDQIRSDLATSGGEAIQIKYGDVLNVDNQAKSRLSARMFNSLLRGVREPEMRNAYNGIVSEDFQFGPDEYFRRIPGGGFHMASEEEEAVHTAGELITTDAAQAVEAGHWTGQAAGAAPLTTPVIKAGRIEVAGGTSGTEAGGMMGLSPRDRLLAGALQRAVGTTNSEQQKRIAAAIKRAGGGGLTAADLAGLDDDSTAAVRQLATNFHGGAFNQPAEEMRLNLENLKYLQGAISPGRDNIGLFQQALRRDIANLKNPGVTNFPVASRIPDFNAQINMSGGRDDLAARLDKISQLLNNTRVGNAFINRGDMENALAAHHLGEVDKGFTAPPPAA